MINQISSQKGVFMLNHNQPIVRSRCLLSLAFGIFAFSIPGIAPVQAFGQATSPVTTIIDAASKSDITVQPLRGNISVLTGSGENIVVLPGPDGKLLVDAGIAVSRAKIQAA